MPHAPMADAAQSAVIVVDIQERLLPHVGEHESLVRRAVQAIRAAGVLGVPILATEQNPRGLGPTVAAVREAWPRDTTPIVKEAFSCWGDAAFRERLQSTQREQVIVVGIEAHVCVLQTVLDLIRVDYEPFVLADAIGSRKAFDWDVALTRMQQAGAVVTTTEALIMEWQRRYTTPTFKAILDIIK